MFDFFTVENLSNLGSGFGALALAIIVLGKLFSKMTKDTKDDEFFEKAEETYEQVTGREV